jgi:hypothetical protein
VTGYSGEFKHEGATRLKRYGVRNHSEDRVFWNIILSGGSNDSKYESSVAMFCTGDEESPDSHNALCLKTGRIYFFISFLLLPFG